MEDGRFYNEIGEFVNCLVTTVGLVQSMVEETDYLCGSCRAGSIGSNAINQFRKISFAKVSFQRHDMLPFASFHRPDDLIHIPPPTYCLCSHHGDFDLTVARRL